VTDSDLLFDTGAWWEYLYDTPVGASLKKRFVSDGRYRLHTSAITLGEMGARLSADRALDRIGPACGAIRRMARVWDVTADIAQEAGVVRTRLRSYDPTASLADAIVVVTASRAGARIVSADPAFRGIPGTVSH
jgi:predicted nucleic acid-binding protein